MGWRHKVDFTLVIDPVQWEQPTVEGEVVAGKGEPVFPESEYTLRALMDNAPDIINRFDRRLRYTFVNLASERVTGIPAEQFLGKTVRELGLETRLADLIESTLRDVFASGQARQIEYEYRGSKGTSYLDGRLVPEPGPDGGIATVLMVTRDITDRRNAERALRESDERFRISFEHAPLGVALLGSHGEILQVNRALCSMLGYADRELLQLSNLREITHPDDIDVNSSVAHEITLELSEAWEIENRYRHRDGHYVWTISSGRKIPWDDTVYYLAHILDISERKEAEVLRRRAAEIEEQNRLVEEANRVKSEFLANMSHELRTPLNAIIGFTELIYDERVGPVTPDQKDFLAEVLASSQHLLHLINDVLDLAKLESGKIVFRPDVVDVGEVVWGVMDAVRQLAAERSLSMDVEIAPEVGRVVLDPVRLRQVLFNYLSNAIKFTFEGGNVIVRVAAEDHDQFRIEVCDSGPGIALADLSRLFIEFEQLHPAVGHKQEGTGLGLVLTKRLVEAQGGYVGVESSPDTGSRFYAILPRDARATANGERL